MSRGEEAASSVSMADVEQLIGRLKRAESTLASAEHEFELRRNSFDTAGELVLAERLEGARRELQQAIRDLDAVVYPADALSGATHA
jgi:hypothetical protein